VISEKPRHKRGFIFYDEFYIQSAKVPSGEPEGSPLYMDIGLDVGVELQLHPNSDFLHGEPPENFAIWSS
jgi:hypothetical protein